jgi:hypothetical protein
MRRGNSMNRVIDPAQQKCRKAGSVIAVVEVVPVLIAQVKGDVVLVAQLSEFETELQAVAALDPGDVVAEFDG